MAALSATVIGISGSVGSGGEISCVRVSSPVRSGSSAPRELAAREAALVVIPKTTWEVVLLTPGFEPFDEVGISTTISRLEYDLGYPIRVGNSKTWNLAF